MADFEKFDLTKNVPITYGNSTGVAAQASDEPMRALPHLPRAVGYRHTMDNTEGIKGNKPQVYFSCTKPAPFGIPGLDFSASYPVTTEALFTAEQMKEYARAALKAQPAPTEAQGNTSNNSSRSQLSGNSGELQPSGNTGEAAQGEYSFSKPKGWINLANPGQSWEQWTKAQGIPTTRGWKISAQGEDSARLDFIEKHAIKGGTYNGITSANVILHEGEWHELGLRAAIDAARARASAETGGVKP